MPKQVGKKAKVCSDIGYSISSSANFTVLTFVLVTHKYFGEVALRPLAWCIRGNCPTVRYVTALLLWV